MKIRRFGQTIKMPSTLAIKHQILRAMHADELLKKASLNSKTLKGPSEPAEQVVS